MKFPFIGVWGKRCQAVGAGQGKCHSHSYRKSWRNEKLGMSCQLPFLTQKWEKQKPFGKVLFQFREENWF